MKRIAALVFSVCFSSTSFANRSFNDYFDDYYKRGLVPSHETARYALKNRYVFIAGFLNEYVENYWGDVIESLQKLAVAHEQITLIRPSSQKSAEKNSKLLQAELEKIPQDLPLVIVAHSKGALELMNFAWSNPEFIDKRVSGLFFVQAPFDGSPIGDIFISGKLKADSSLSWFSKIALEAQFLTEGLFLKSYHKALLDLTNDFAKRWQVALQFKTSAIHEKIKDRFYTITSSESLENLFFDIGTSANYMNRKFSPNDGVVPLSSQTLDILRDNIAYLVADHSDFVMSSHKPKTFRTAFGWAIVSLLEARNRNSENL